MGKKTSTKLAKPAAKPAGPVFRKTPFHREHPVVLAKRQLDPTKVIESNPQMGANSFAPGTLQSLTRFLAKPKKDRDGNMLDNIIYKQANAQVSFRVIAEMVGLSPAEVKAIYFRMLEAENSFSPVQMRMMLTAQMQNIINMMQEAAAAGSVEHAKIIVSAVERLAKMHELESQKSTIEIKLITDEQSLLFIAVVQQVVQAILSRPEIAQILPADVIDEVTADTLHQAGVLITNAQDRVLEG